MNISPVIWRGILKFWKGAFCVDIEAFLKTVVVFIANLNLVNILAKNELL